LEAAIERVKYHGYTPIVFDSNLDMAKQMSGMENMIIQKVDAIVTLPVDAKAGIEMIKKANKAGIPVVTQDVTADGGEIFNYIATDNYRAGELAGEYIAWRLKGKGDIVTLNINLNSAGRARMNGLLNVLKHYPDIRIVGDQEAYTVEVGVDVMSNFLQAHKHLDAVWAVNDPAGLGALRAIKAAGREDEMFIVATDGDPAAVSEVKKGGCYAMTIAQFPVELSYNAVDAAVNAIEGKPPIENVKIVGQPSPVPLFFTPVFPITAENYEEFGGWDKPAPRPIIPPWWK
jgi:ribose transport system substrate-binding protein